MNNKITKIKHKLVSSQIDAVLITSPYNISYLSGIFPSSIEERESYIFITKENAYLIAPKMYLLAIEKDDDFISLEMTAEIDLYENIIKICREEKIKSVGFEQKNLTYKEFDNLSKSLDKIKLIPLEGLVEKQRQIKDKSEIEKIKKACEITDNAYSYILNNIKTNITEKELAWNIESYFKKNDSDIAFSTIVAFGKNSAIPHHLSNSTKLIKNSFVLLDFGAKYKGYCADMSRTIYFGEPKSKEIKIYNTLLEAQKMALEKLKEWQDKKFQASHLHEIAESHIEQKGFSQIPHSLGHGIGLQVHEPPTISKYTEKNPLKEDMIITIEPGIYIPSLGGVRIEDDVLLTKKGYEVLTKSPRQLTIIK